MKQALFFQILSDETRLRALALMAASGELCVCELVHALDLSQPKISRHMATLRESGIVGSRREAQWMFYQIDSSLPQWQRKVIDAALSGLAGDKTILQDRKRLEAMKERPKRRSAA